MTPTSVVRFRSRFGLLQWPMLLWLTAVWMLLWGQLSLLTALGGLAVAVVASIVFPLPPVRLNLRVRPLALVRLVTKFFTDVVVSSIQVARVVLRPRQRPLRNAIVEVNLKTPSEFVLTVVAEMTCLIPGSLVVEARRSTHTLFLHVLDVGDAEGAERFRQSVLAQEDRVVRALGAEIAHLDDLPDDPADHPAGGKR
ncbi:Na+/H+ antiporter subunit E [Sporichthya brevicatena]|uniref:Na+/H+ antiporter subunit E n=1 Tax=Sporichthya brevicatena TaxID=171442 RepID=A0ABP3RGG0_9ACTN